MIAAMIPAMIGVETLGSSGACAAVRVKLPAAAGLFPVMVSPWTGGIAAEIAAVPGCRSEVSQVMINVDWLFADSVSFLVTTVASPHLMLIVKFAADVPVFVTVTFTVIF